MSLHPTLKDTLVEKKSNEKDEPARVHHPIIKDAPQKNKREAAVSPSHPEEHHSKKNTPPQKKKSLPNHSLWDFTIPPRRTP